MIQPVKSWAGREGELGFVERQLAFGVRCPLPAASARAPQCVDEHTGAPLLDPKTVPADIHIESVQSIGRYAVGILWSDGHRTGIYPL